MKIPVKLLLTKNIIGINYEAYTGNRAFNYEGECISYSNRDQNVPKEIINCFKRGYSLYAMLYDFDSNSPLSYDPKFKG